MGVYVYRSPISITTTITTLTQHIRFAREEHHSTAGDSEQRTPDTGGRRYPRGASPGRY